MAGNRLQDIRPEPTEARKLLSDRLQRKEMGAEHYDEMVRQFDGRAFKLFGIVFIAIFAIIAFAVAGLGY
jgi:hypothetical protein